MTGSPSPGMGLGFTRGHEIAPRAGLRFKEHLTREGARAGRVTASQQTRVGFQVSQ